AGGWKIFLDDIAPLAQQLGVDLGTIDSVGSHVLLVDRQDHRTYAAPRPSAERFLCEWYGLAIPRRQCLCGHINCASCKTSAGSQIAPDSGADENPMQQTRL